MIYMKIYENKYHSQECDKFIILIMILIAKYIV